MASTELTIPTNDRVNSGNSFYSLGAYDASSTLMDSEHGFLVYSDSLRIYSFNISYVLPSAHAGDTFTSLMKNLRRTRN